MKNTNSNTNFQNYFNTQIHAHKKQISIAHSPDADDIFMYEAINLGWVSSDFIYKRESADIQTLNNYALINAFDVCAISFALYPLIVKDYALLNTAASFGNGYGPKLLKKKNKTLKRNFKVALSGEHTTNALLFRFAYPNAKIIYKNFLDIQDAILNDEVDAGVLIHESILDFDDNLCVEKELWDIWREFVFKYHKKENIPLPLGGMALSRSLPITDAIKIERELKNGVKIAVKNKQILSRQLLKMGCFRVDDKNLQKYLNMYANDQSVEFDEVAILSLDILFDLFKRVYGGDFIMHAKDFLIPSEYEKFRYED